MPSIAGRPKFFVDAMLGNIARKLRLFGYDSRYDPGISDGELIRIARDEARTVVTRDRGLAGRCRRFDLDLILVSKTGDREQVLEVLGHFLPGACPEVSGDAARCTKCNSVTRPVSRQDVSGVLPAGVLELNEKFWKCAGCGQVYWEGTHIKNIQKLVGRCR